MFPSLATATNQRYSRDILLPLVSSYSDLGVIITKDLSPATYINKMVVKTHQRDKMIHKCFISQNVQLSTRAFVTYVRSLLDNLVSQL